MDSPKQPRIWIRVLCAVVSIGALYVVLDRISMRALMNALRGTRWGWFIAAVALNGALFLPAAWRWHLVLRMTGTAVHPGASGRLTLIGHFFYNILFGAVGGDTAKSALYARWFGFPLPRVLAAAPLDRFLGFAGLLIFGLFVLVSGGLAGAFTRIGTISLRWPGKFLWALPLALLILLAVSRLPKGKNSWRTFRDTFLGATKALCSSRTVAVQGVLCGFIVQLALAGVIACNVKAVTHLPLPWHRLLWTFPVITMISALPITIGGLGMREGAALLLLGFYGVPAAEAVDASLLTFLASLSWTIAGGLLWWREGSRALTNRTLPTTISVVIPALNEARHLPETIRQAQKVPQIREIIVVDGGSSDDTRRIATELGCTVLQHHPGRGGQMRRGAEQARGDIVLLLHADTWLPPKSGEAIINCLRDTSVVAGGFWKSFREPVLMGSRLRCAIRLYLGKRIMGDQAIFIVRHELEQVGGVPDMPLMEEFELCRRLRQRGRLALADATVTTSARRFKQLGVLRTYLRMWMVTLRYWLGASPKELNRLYEKEAVRRPAKKT